jgi:hypothetical protein
MLPTNAPQFFPCFGLAAWLARGRSPHFIGFIIIGVLVATFAVIEGRLPRKK